MPGRGLGERLAVDPNNNKIIYFGARSGNGLWKSDDQGVSFSKVSDFPATGTYEPDPSDTSGYNSDPIGLAWITFNKASGTSNGATSQIFVAVADNTTSNIYVSNDAGSTWSAVSGQPIGFVPHKGKIAPDGNLYLTYSNGAGPYDGTNGSVYKYSLASHTWTDITPTSGSYLYYGFGGLAVDAQKSGTIMVASLNAWWPDLIIFRSNNSVRITFISTSRQETDVQQGTTWSRIWDWGTYPDRILYYGYNASLL